MKPFLHPDLKRGSVAERCAIVLLLGLLVVLVVSMVHGIHSFPA